MASAQYVYAIVQRGSRLPTELIGIGDTPIQSLAAGALAAVTSTLDAGQIPPTADNLLCHGAVVETVRARVPALPVRFGTILPDAGAVTQAISQREAALSADIARLGVKVELGALVLWDREQVSGKAAAGGSEPMARQQEPTYRLREDERNHVSGDRVGTSYLRMRYAAYQHQALQETAANTLIEGLRDQLREYVDDSQYAIQTVPRLAVRAAYLLDGDRVTTCRTILHAICQSRTNVRVLVSGPWPPYSFITRP